MALSLEPGHLSVYGLTIEPHTPLGRWTARGQSTESPEERYEAEFLEAHRRLTAAGYEHYEVSNYGKRGNGVLMREGLVIAIEPMVNLGKKDVAQGKDGWTISTADRKPSAHYEHTVAVRKNHADILSDHDPIEAAVAMNPELKTVEAKEEIAALMA